MANDGEIKVLDKCIVESEVVAAQSFMQCPILRNKVSQEKKIEVDHHSKVKKR